MSEIVIKSERLLLIYSQLVNGKILSKKQLAQQFAVTERSIQRDIESLRCFFAEQDIRQQVVYDHKAKGYRLEEIEKFSNNEILAVCKILLESRSLLRDEMSPLIEKLIDCCVPQESRKKVSQMIKNELYHYIEPHHGQHILPGLWEIGQAVQEHRLLEIVYERMKEPKLVHRRVQPVGIMFSEYYFYLTAFLENKTYFENPDDLFPTIYRIDRIQSFRVLDEHFSVPYRERFQEGEFRKRVQFMYGGKLERIKFRYTGLSVEAVLDRLPTAKILHHNGNEWLIEAEVFGKGIEMWLRSQGEFVNMVE